MKKEGVEKMNIFVVGATGRVGQETIDYLLQKNHHVYAGVRDLTRIKEKEGLTPVVFDLHASAKEIAEKFNGMDVVYFLAGSRGKDLLKTDLFGAVKVMEAAKKANVKRYIQLSSLYAMEPEKWTPERYQIAEESFEELVSFNIAKFFSDHWLMDHTDLAYTILQPSALVEEKGTHKITTEISEIPKTNPISDVAYVLSCLIDYPNTIGKTIMMQQGTQDVTTVLENI